MAFGACACIERADDVAFFVGQQAAAIGVGVDGHAAQGLGGEALLGEGEQQRLGLAWAQLSREFTQAEEAVGGFLGG